MRRGPCWKLFGARRSLGEPERIVGEQGKGGVNAGPDARIHFLAANCFVYLFLTMSVARRFPGRPSGAPRAG
jgi:hypothetical protein